VAFLGNRADSRIARPICEAQFGGKAGYDHEEFTGDYEHAGGSFGANDGLELCIWNALDCNLYLVMILHPLTAFCMKDLPLNSR
jgi:hypothetical protein